MNVRETLALADARGVKLRVDGDGKDLAFRAPKGALTPELREAMATHKVALIAFLSGGASPDAVAPVPRTSIVESEPSPLSAGQARLWFLDRLSPGSPLYNVHFGVRLRGSLDGDALSTSLEALVARHGMLRATFPEIDGRPMQVVGPPRAWELCLVDLRDDPDRDATLARLAKEEAAAPFDLARGPLLRTTLVALEPTEHVLLLTQHHIITDGSSLSIMAKDLFMTYLAIMSGKPTLAAEPPLRYVDYVKWQETELISDETRRVETWWKERLSDLPRLELPTARSSPSHAGDMVSFTLPPELTARLKDLARRESTTLFVTLLAVWSTLLHRYSQQVDFAVGTVTSGRDRRELADIIGFFVNTLVLRCDLSGDPDGKTLIGRLRETTAQALEHQELPFDRVVNAVGAPRGKDLNPLFRAAFGLESVALPTFDMQGLSWERTAQRPDGGVAGTTKFDVGLTCVEHEHGLWCAIEYATDLFEAEVIERMAGHFRMLAEGLLEAPERKVSELTLLTDAERHRVVVEWNAAALDYDRNACLHELVEASVVRTPGAVAVVAGSASLTYAELDARAEKLASYLQSLGIGPETLVGICTERGLDMVVGMLAVLKAGGGYVPLDPDYPRARLEHMLADSGAPVVLTQRKVELPETAARAIYLDDDIPEAPARERTARPDNVAYCIYTSGSTGKPKGVVLEHRNAVSFVAWAQGEFSREDLTRVVFATSICFDLSIFELFATLAAGGTAVVVRNALALLDEPIAAPSLINTVPSAAQALVDAGALPEGLRILNLAGEPLRRELADAIFAARPGVRLYNLYGPTESTTYSTYTEVRPGERVTIGRPLAGTQVYLLDPRREPVPIGVPGEVYIAGAGLARGYRERPELTAERFVETPLGRMYRTGDLGRHLPDGNIDYLGRIDHQVKVRGFRIELGEIETALGKIEGVRRAVVLAREDVPGDKRLVAYLAAESPIGDGEVRARIGESLPDYMVPSAFVWLEAFPLTPNGKVDRKSLPAPDETGREAYVAPETPTEEALAAIFADVLGIERPGRHENFFALGGHSLIATQVTSRVRRGFGIELPLRAVFDAPTVATLARRIDQAERSARPPLGREERPDEIPLSFAQQRLWFFDRLEPESSLYDVPVTMRLRGALDVARLETALQTVVSRHEAMRTVFPASAGRPRQEILPELRMTVTVVRVRDDAELGRRVRSAAHRPFDLARGPLVRAMLFELSAEDHLLLVDMHHIITDGWSLGILVRELSELYRGGELPPLAVQYADYSAWNRRWLATDAVAGELAYWKKTLGGAPPLLELPTDRPHPPLQTYRGGAVQVALSPELLRGLKELARREGATLFVALLAGWNLLLQRYSGQDDIVVGTPIAGRTEAATEPLLGLFVNTLAIRTDLSGNPTARELLGRVRETTLGAYAHQELPFEKLLDHLVPDRQLSRTRLFQVLFVLQNAPFERMTLGDCKMEPYFVEPETAKFDLTLSLQETDGCLDGHLEYASDLYDRATIERMVDHYRILLEGLVAAPARSVGEIALVADAPTFPQVIDDPRCIHALFEDAARRRPDAVAVVCDDARLTYRELDERANRLAHRLRSLGVGPEVRVALFLERSLDMLVAIVGVLKAGGAYVPLEPSHPEERIAFMLRDCAAPVVIATSPLADRLPVPALLLDREDLSSYPQSAPSPLADAGSCVYVIYTSGSTGVPKGVEVLHRNVVRLFTATDAWFHFDERDVWTLFHSYAFDFSVWEIWGALAHGGRLVVVPYEVSRSPDAFRALVGRERVTVLNQTPSAFRLFVAADSGNDLALRYVIFGGEAVDLPSLGPWFARHGDERPQLINMYGITETTVHVTYRRLHAADVKGGSPSPIGVPIPDLAVRILDPQGNLQPPGVPGEMVVGGGGVSRGYLHRPELTAERFAGGFYRSGDKGRWLADGTLEYLGRIDQQVKIRGFRIELGEIETLLGQHPALREAVVVARDDDGEKRLVAYVVARDEVPTTSDLRAHLKRRLPEYMVPALFVVLPALPLTANGKVDKKALPAPERARPELARAYAAPRTPAETHLARIWAEVLKLERVGIDDRFFELGGDSILSIQVVARAHAAGMQLSVRALFQHQTIRELAQTLGSEDGLAEVVPPLVVDRTGLPDDIEDAYPLAQLQTGMVYHSESQSAVYHDITSFHVEYVIEPGRMRQALDEMSAAHAILRTSFDFTRHAEPLQLVHRRASIPLVVEDWRALPDQEARLDEVLEADKRRGFDFAVAPLCRVYLHRRSETSTQITLVNHHAILDGWSVAALLTELMQRLVGFPPADAPASTYRDFVALERAALSSETTRQFWREHTEDAPLAVLPRGRDAGRPRRLRDVPIATETSAALKRLALDAGVPLKSVLLAAHLRAMSVWSGQVDVVTGLVANGRPERTDAERALGLFLNTLPFRLRVGHGSWLDLARDTFATERSLLLHRRYPLAEIQADHGAPLFDAAFNFIHFHVYKTLGSAGLGRVISFRSYELTNFRFVANFSLDLTDGDVCLQISVSAPELSDAQVDEIGGYYEQTLLAMARDPSANVLAVRLAPDAPHAEPAISVDLLERILGQDPDAIAVVESDRSITYRELGERSQRLARRLAALGVGPDDRVALLVPRSIDMVVALLGILRAGGAYVPLEPGHPTARLSWILEDSGAKVLLASRGLAGRLPGAVILDDSGPEAEPKAPTPGSLAYVIYTSGSTGTPKGVLVEHRNLAALVGWELSLLPLGPGARATQVASLGFDAATLEIWPPLAAGATLAIVDDDLRAAPERLLAWMAETGVTESFLPTPLAEAVLALPWPETMALRTLMTGGDRLHRRPPAGARYRLVNLYGPTETTVVATAGVVPCEGVDAPTIGQAIAGTRVQVLDANGQPVPVGVAGELTIGGAGVARGYLGRPELTAERFAGGVYRSGDRVRRGPDGDLEYLGRIDSQVKIRGHRIELGEIEHVILAHPGVGETAIVVSDDRLVAYLAPRLPGDLRDALKARLPEYMVPAVFVALPALPQNASGKIDRKALPAADLGAEDFVAPRTPVEETVARLFAEVLRRERVSVADDFFALGGHSLVATQVVNRVRVLFGVELPLRALFEAPTVTALARRVESALSSGETARLPLVPGTRPDEIPLSFAQERLWFLDRLEPGSTAYHVPLAVRLRGPLGVEKLRRALDEIVARHEVLRTSFPMGKEGPRQEIRAHLALDLPILPYDEAMVAREAATPFDLAKGPLVRAVLLHEGPEEHILLLTFHHIVADGWSIGVLTDELATLYAGGAPRELPIQVADHAIWQRRSLDLAGLLGWWQQALAGAPPALELPTDRPRAAVASSKGAAVPVVLGTELTSALYALSRREGATLFMTLLAGWQALLARYAGQTDIVVGTPIAGRTEAETERLIGLFVNTLALRTDLSGDPTVREVLSRVRAATLGAYAHQALPFEKLIEGIGPARDLSRSPLFQTMFVLQNAPAPRLGLGDVTLEPLPGQAQAAKFELTLSLAEKNGRLEGSLEYMSDLYERSTIERLLRHFAALLTGMLDADARVAALSILAPEERADLLAVGDGGILEVPELCIHELFEAQARATPEAIALDFRGATLSYRALDERASRLAGHLANLGVGPEARVGICLARGLDLVVAVLGVLKAGGAYVPLDPAYPRARIDHMLADSGARVLIADGDALTAEIVVRMDGELVEGKPQKVAPSNLAYCIYTSGSTGKPKGVALTHGNAVSFLAWARTAFDRDDLARVLFSTSVCFDLSIFEMFAPLACGGTVVIVENALALLDAPADVSLVNTVPSAAQALLSASALPSARVLNLAGEPLRRELCDGLQAALPTTRIYNLYGPTEYTTYTTYTLVAAEAKVTIGRPLPNTRIHLLDGHRAPVPRGVAGEIYVAGAGLAREYLGRPDLTAERFVADPTTGGRMYRTGDLGRFLPDGTIEYLGRIDHQVKVRGFRIELGEIEEALGRAGVKEAVVLAREDVPGEKRLVAYLVGAPRSDLRARLSESLPEFMIPSDFVWLEAFPLNPNGKIDRKALPAPERTGPNDEGDEGRPAFGATEIALARIWEELLGKSPVGARADFFGLGGHSLLAVTLLRRVEEHFGKAVALSSFFQRPTVEGLATELGTAGGSRPWSPLVKLTGRGRGRPFFCVHPGLGSVARYDGLARRLGDDRPFYALTAIGLEHGQTPDGRVEDMATRYLEAVRRAQPSGPYLLGGHSFGGLVAYEMARQVTDAGENVELLALLDTTAPGPLWSSAGAEEEGLGILALFRDADLPVDADALLRLGPEEQIERYLQAVRDAGAIPAAADLEHVRKMVEWRTRVVPAAYRAYTPSVYAGVITLVRASEKPPIPGIDRVDLDPFAGWTSLSSRPLAVRWVPGDHFSMIRPPHVQALAWSLRRELHAVDPGQGLGESQMPV